MRLEVSLFRLFEWLVGKSSFSTKSSTEWFRSQTCLRGYDLLSKESITAITLQFCSFRYISYHADVVLGKSATPAARTERFSPSQQWRSRGNLYSMETFRGYILRICAPRNKAHDPSHCACTQAELHSDDQMWELDGARDSIDLQTKAN
jgi:hypothetical protein